MIAFGLLFLTLFVAFTVAIGLVHEAIRARRRNRHRVPVERYQAIHCHIIEKEPSAP